MSRRFVERQGDTAQCKPDFAVFDYKRRQAVVYQPRLARIDKMEVVCNEVISAVFFGKFFKLLESRIVDFFEHRQIFLRHIVGI